MPYCVWLAKYSRWFSNANWLAKAALTTIPPAVRALFERKAGEESELKVCIGPCRPDYATFHDAGAFEMPLRHTGIVVKDMEVFISRLRESEYKHAVATPLGVPAGGNGAAPPVPPVPPIYSLATRDAKVSLVTVTALSSGFSDAVNRSEWCVGSDGTFVSMSFYLDLVHRRPALVGNKIDACIMLERSMLHAKTTALEVFNGPRASAASTHSGESLGILCARYRKATEELVLHLSDVEYALLQETFPVLQDILSGCTRRRVETSSGVPMYFYDVPFKVLKWTESDTWIGRILVHTFVSTREGSGTAPATLLILKAVYINME